jgi:hypothetical protein
MIDFLIKSTSLAILLALSLAVRKEKCTNSIDFLVVWFVVFISDSVFTIEIIREIPSNCTKYVSGYRKSLLS